MSQDTLGGNVVGAIEALRKGAELIRSNGKTPYKGLTKEMKAQWANDIEVILSNPQADLEVIWDDLALFPTEVTVEGVAKAWKKMSSELRLAYRKRLRLLNPEKEAGQRFSLILHFLESDSMSALELLCEVAPKNADTLKRAIKTILCLDYQSIQRLFPQEAPVPVLAKAIEKVIVLIQHGSVEQKARWAVAKAILSMLAQRELFTDPLFAESIQALRTVAGALPSTYQSDLEGLLGNWKVEEKNRPPDEPSLQPQAAIAAVSPTTSVSDEAVNTSINEPSAIGHVPMSGNRHEADIRSAMPSLQNWKAFITNWRDNLKNQAEMLELLLSYEDPAAVNVLRKQLTEAREARREAEARANEAKLSAEEFKRKAADAAKRSRNLEELLNDLRTRLERAESELGDATRKNQSLLIEMESKTAQHSREMHDLNQHITANAELRLGEFRERLASSLRDLLSKVPALGANVDGELGAILLLRLHEVMDRLEASQIQVRSKGTAV